MNSEKNKLQLSIIDNIQVLHITSYKLGMICQYHEALRVGCGANSMQHDYDDFVDDSNNISNTE